jgi:hypothetical protein
VRAGLRLRDGGAHGHAVDHGFLFGMCHTQEYDRSSGASSMHPVQ